MPNSIQAKELLQTQIFNLVLPDLMIEAIVDQCHPTQLCLHTWDGRAAGTIPTVSFRGCRYEAAPVPAGLSRAVRFPGSSKPFGTVAQLTSSLLKFLDRYASLPPDAAALTVAFALSSWVEDCFVVTPLLHLLGPDGEVNRALRLLNCLCRRPILLSDFDVAALSSLPSHLDPTLLVKQHSLGRRLTRILLGSNDRHFRVARGKSEIYAYGAKAFASSPEFANGAGVRISIPPVQEVLPILTDAEEAKIAADFQAKLLRFRLCDHGRVSQVQLDIGDFVPAMREEVQAWLAPISDCPDLYNTVSDFLLQQSREAEGERISDGVGQLAKTVRTLLIGRHEDRVLGDKKVGSLLRALGIHGERVVKGYRISLTTAVRERIHSIAKAYRVMSITDGVARCPQCAPVSSLVNT